MENLRNTVVNADVFDFLARLPDESVNCFVTSPPYYGLRDYSTDGQIGLESSLDEYITTMVAVFEEVRRVLRGDGTVWLNVGDSYANDGKWGGNTGGIHAKALHGNTGIGRNKVYTGLKPKDLMLVPQRLVIRLQEAGWWVRSDIIWCLSGGTRIYAKTQKGEMPMTIKDMVRLDPSTVKLWNGQKWTQVLGWSETPRPTQPIEIQLRSGEKLACTPDHVWPTERGNVAAKELQVGDVIKWCQLPQPRITSPPEYIPNHVGWFVGLYLAEGSRGKDGAVIQIAGHVNEVERLRRLERLTAQYGGTCQVHHVGGNSATIHIYSRVMSAILDTYLVGKTSKDKHLSTACWQRHDNFIQEILEGYLEGDGHWEEDNRRWRLGFTRNYALADDLRTICARLGYQFRLKLSTAKNQTCEFKTFRGEIRYLRSGHHNQKSDTEVIAIGKSNARKFWDIGVEDEPHLFALASGVLTHNSKPNPMPESVTDRPTKSHEYVFLLTKSGNSQFWTHRDGKGASSKPAPDYRYQNQLTGEETDIEPEDWRGARYSENGKRRKLWRRVNLWRGHDYFYDGDSIRESVAREWGDNNIGNNNWSVTGVTEGIKLGRKTDPHCGLATTKPNPAGRNKRTVWTIPTQPLPMAHFATFPQALITPMIRAGCPREVCGACGSPVVRVVGHQRGISEGYNRPKFNQQGGKFTSTISLSGGSDKWLKKGSKRTTTGFTPTCDCNAPRIPGLVIDPFGGSGTVALVAIREGRDYILNDLSPEYCDMARDRIARFDPAQDTPVGDDGEEVQLSLWGHDGN